MEESDTANFGAYILAIVLILLIVFLFKDIINDFFNWIISFLL